MVALLMSNLRSGRKRAMSLTKPKSTSVDSVRSCASSIIITLMRAQRETECVCMVVHDSYSTTSGLRGRERETNEEMQGGTYKENRKGGRCSYNPPTTLLQPKPKKRQGGRCSYNPPTTLLQPKTQAPVCSQVWFSKKFAQQHAICHVLDQRLVTGAVLKADGVANLDRQVA
jgi:hypothetical protein